MKRLIFHTPVVRTVHPFSVRESTLEIIRVLTMAKLHGALDTCQADASTYKYSIWKPCHTEST